MKRHCMIIVPLIAAFVILGACTFSQVYIFDKQNEQEIERYLQIIGELENGVKPEYAITDILKNTIKPDAIARGRERINAYGFEADYIPRHIQSYSGSKHLILLSFGSLTALFLPLIFTHLYYLRKNKKEHQNIILILEQFINGCYSTSSSCLTEGDLSCIYHLLDRLGQMILTTNSRLKKEKEETKSLVTDMSHQLKTPLASLKMCFSLLTEETLTPEEKHEFTQRTWAQIHKLSDLITALVHISRMEHGMITIKPEKADISKTLIEAVNTVYVKAEEKNISIKADYLPSVQIYHDIRWTREAFTNVLENALKYSPHSTTITITIHQLKTYIRIEIADEGLGIKKSEYNQIFQRFYRGKEEAVKSQEGSGVGLYLTRKILEKQESNIFAASNPEKGSTFIIHMPLVRI